jgi:hypothetical protein
VVDIEYTKRVKDLFFKLNKIKPEVWLILILVFALFLRLYFFVGLVNAGPQDDGIYIGNIKYIVDGNHDIKNFKELVLEETVNPVHGFKVRNGFIFPAAFFVTILGFNQLGFTFYSLISSLLLSILSYYFGKNILGSYKIGLLSAFLISIFPLNIIFSTKISPEVPLTLFISLSIYFFMLYFKNENKGFLFPLLSGLFAAAASTIKTFGIILFPVLLFTGLFYLKIDFKKTLKIIVPFVIGFILIFGINEAYFYSETGNILLQSKISKKSQLDNFERQDFVGNNKILNILNVKTIFGEPLEYSKLMFNIKTPRKGIFYFGFFYYLFLLCLIYLVYILKKEWNAYNKSIFPILLWFFVGLGILAMFPIMIKWNSNMLEWLLIPKHARMLNYLTIPTVLIIATALLKIKAIKFRNILLIVIVLFLTITSINFTNFISQFYKEGIKDSKEISKLIPDLNGYIYTDYLAFGQINYFTGYKFEDKIKNIHEIRNVSELKGAYVIIGGGRSVDVEGEAVKNILPDSIKPALINEIENWTLIREIKGKKTPNRKYDMKLYYVN